MSSRQELVSPEGLRQDGRRPSEIRPISATLGIFSKTSGSATLSHGNTKIIALLNGPSSPKESSSISGPSAQELYALGNPRDIASFQSGSINVHIHAAAFSSTGGERTKRLRVDHRLREWERKISTCLTGVVMTELFPRSVLNIHLEILSADGAVLPSCVNASTLALLDAGIPMKDFLLATTAIYLPGQKASNGMFFGSNIIVDPTRQEELSTAPIMRAFCTGRGQEIIGTLVERKMPIDKLELVAEECKQACARMFTYFDQHVVRPYVTKIITDRMIQEQRIESVRDRRIQEEEESERRAMS